MGQNPLATCSLLKVGHPELEGCLPLPGLVGTGATPQKGGQCSSASAFRQQGDFSSPCRRSHHAWGSCEGLELDGPRRADGAEYFTDLSIS